MPDVNDPNLPHCAAASDFWQKWKVRSFLMPKESITLMDVAGPGVI